MLDNAIYLLFVFKAQLPERTVSSRCFHFHTSDSNIKSESFVLSCLPPGTLQKVPTRKKVLARRSPLTWDLHDWPHHVTLWQWWASLRRSLNEQRRVWITDTQTLATSKTLLPKTKEFDISIHLYLEGSKMLRKSSYEDENGQMKVAALPSRGISERATNHWVSINQKGPKVRDNP